MDTTKLDRFLDEHPEWKTWVEWIVRPPSGRELHELFPDIDREVSHKAFEFAQPFITRGALYAVSRKLGNDDRFASMVAMRRPCRAMTDDVFWGGRKHFSEVYGEEYANRVRQSLSKQGIELGSRGEYCPELAQYEGDPRAVIKGRGDVERVRERVMREPERDPLDRGRGLADDLVVETARNFAASNPDEARKMSAGDLKEHMVAQHGSK